MNKEIMLRVFFTILYSLCFVTLFYTSFIIFTLINIINFIDYTIYTKN